MGARANVWTRMIGIGLFAGLSVAGHALSPDPSQDGAARFVRARSGGALLLNFADTQALSVRRVAAGGLLRVHDESVGFLDVEALGGVEVWVFGEFLEATSDPDLLRVTESRVNMRPRPGASVSNMPLRTKLQRGDHLRLIERADSGKSLAEDWVKVWSPQRARAWVLVAETEPVTDTSSAVVEWDGSKDPAPPAKARAVDAAGTASGSAGGAAAKTEMETKAAPAVEAPEEARAALVAADAMFEATRASGSTDYAPVIAAYQRVLVLAPEDSMTAELATRRLGETEAQAALVQLKTQLADEETRRQEKLDQIALADEKRDLASKPRWGRFDGRGWVVRKEGDEGGAFVLRWAGRTDAHILCTSGRYDLPLFEGYEIGVTGAPISGSGEVPVLDVQRIEVISASGARGQ